MTKSVSIISPIDNSVVAERTLSSPKDISSALEKSVQAQKQWARYSIVERAEFCHKAIVYFEDNSDDIAREITQQMGRPLQYTAGEIKALAERGRHMIAIAEEELSDIILDKQIAEKQTDEDQTCFTRFIRPTPLGVVLSIAPWNYPYLTAVNSIIPALMAGNSVILKHSAQTLLCAERFAEAFQAVGLPEGVFQYLHLDHDSTASLIQQKAIAFISFTGSVAGGDAVEKSAAGLFKGVALELGGKDPAYVRQDANLTNAVENLVDGAFFNSGQSCCGIERIYVHNTLYEEFVEQFIELVKQYRLGNPMEPETNLGPMVNTKSAEFVRQQVDQAISQGATPCIDSQLFTADKPGTPYLAPQVLIDVDHSMDIMREESFGPVVGIMKVDSDEEAIQLMNDSAYGLTASLWTKDEDKAIELGNQLETGTVFMNRCDYLDPALAWVGVKDSGRGCALSRLGYQQLTRPKSFHLKTSPTV